MSWTDDRIDILRRMWAEGSASGDIARAIGKTRNAVMGKIDRLGLIGDKGKAAPSESPPERRTPAFCRTEAIAYIEPLCGEYDETNLLHRLMIVTIAAACGKREHSLLSEQTGLDASEVSQCLNLLDASGVWPATEGHPEDWACEQGNAMLLIDVMVATGELRRVMHDGEWKYYPPEWEVDLTERLQETAAAV